MPQIEDFTDIEAVIKSILQLRNSVLVHKTNGTYIDSVKKEIQHIQLICTTGSSDTIFRNLTAEARTIVFDKFIMPLMVLQGDALEKEILVRDHSLFCKRINAAKMPNAYLDGFCPDDRENSPDQKKQSEKMKKVIYRNYFQEFWSGMHQEMFGANRYRAFQLELEHLKHHIVKPYEVSVHKAMQRIDVLLTYLPFFPPRTVRSNRPSDTEWAAFESKQRIYLSHFLPKSGIVVQCKI